MVNNNPFSKNLVDSVVDRVTDRARSKLQVFVDKGTNGVIGGKTPNQYDNFSVERFKSAVLSNGLARPNRFRTIIISPVGTPGDDELVSLFCESTQLPQLIMQTKPFRIQGVTHQRVVGAEYGGEGIAMMFHIDREMRVKKYFDEWAHAVINRGEFSVNYFDNYRKDITIEQLDEQDNVTYSLRLIDAFPRAINLVELDHGSTNQTHRLNVLFAYKYWETLDVNHTNAVSGSLTAANFNYDPSKPDNKNTTIK